MTATFFVRSSQTLNSVVMYTKILLQSCNTYPLAILLLVRHLVVLTRHLLAGQTRHRVGHPILLLKKKNRHETCVSHCRSVDTMNKRQQKILLYIHCHTIPNCKNVWRTLICKSGKQVDWHEERHNTQVIMRWQITCCAGAPGAELCREVSSAGMGRRQASSMLGSCRGLQPTTHFQTSTFCFSFYPQIIPHLLSWLCFLVNFSP